MHDSFPARNCLTSPEGLNLIIHFFNLPADSTNYPENTEFTLVEMTEFILGAPGHGDDVQRNSDCAASWRLLSFGVVQRTTTWGGRNPRRLFDEREYTRDSTSKNSYARNTSQGNTN